MTIPVHAYAWQRTEKVVNNYRANQGVDILEKNLQEQDSNE